jgi:diketogulonate reductase-like aldo/keto reductase
VAIAWILGWPGVTAAIVGARTPEQVNGWIDAANLDLTPLDLIDISAAIKRSGAGNGPSMPNWESGEPRDFDGRIVEFDLQQEESSGISTDS